MKLLLTAVMAMAPALALAQAQDGAPLDDATLRQYNDSCIQQCTQSRSYAFCAEACGCMTAEMQRKWSSEDFRRYTEMLSQRDGSVEVRGRLSKMAEYCLERAARAAE